MDMMDGETEVRDYGLERLMMLSDGVFAIAMTLLALDLRPEGPWDHTLAGLRSAIAGPFQAFFWSFFAASVFWAGHRRQFGSYRRSDAVITFFNLLLLGEIILTACGDAHTNRNEVLGRRVDALSRVVRPDRVHQRGQLALRRVPDRCAALAAARAR
jgi:hypothetical protein